MDKKRDPSLLVDFFNYASKVPELVRKKEDKDKNPDAVRSYQNLLLGNEHTLVPFQNWPKR